MQHLEGGYITHWTEKAKDRPWLPALGACNDMNTDSRTITILTLIKTSDNTLLGRLFFF